MDDSLLDLYMLTHYTVHAAEGQMMILIGQSSPEVDQLIARHQARSWAFITAYNPRSKELPTEQNEQRQSELKTLLTNSGHLVMPGVGRDPAGSWQEPSFFVIGISRDEASALGIQFEQNAYVAGELGGLAELIDLRSQLAG